MRERGGFIEFDEGFPGNENTRRNMIFAMLCLMGRNWKSHWKSEMLNESSQSSVASIPSSAFTMVHCHCDKMPYRSASREESLFWLMVLEGFGSAMVEKQWCRKQLSLQWYKTVTGLVMIVWGHCQSHSLVHTKKWMVRKDRKASHKEKSHSSNPLGREGP